MDQDLAAQDQSRAASPTSATAESCGFSVVVIGASAGGVEALREVMAGLPSDLPAAVLVVLHVASGTPSVLPRILGRVCALPVAHARDGERIEPGRVYVAPPDVHLLVGDGRTRLVRGPRENGVRPAVDPLFRSAAAAYGACVTGVVLSGTMDDGTLGLGAIKRSGGTAVVQDPAEALFAGMPRNAIERIDVDHVVPLAAMPPLLAAIARAQSTAQATQEPIPMEHARVVKDELEVDPAREVDGGTRQNEALGGRLSGFTCPECHGALWEMHTVDGVRYRCRVGHAFTEDLLHDAKGVSIEAAIWTALTALEEQAALVWRMARRAGDAGHGERERRYADKARLLEQRAQLLEQVLRTTTFAAPPAEAGETSVSDTGAP